MPTALAVLSLLLLTGCATTEDPASVPPTAASDTPPSGEYPMWTKVTGALLTPFTGVSKSASF